MRVHEPEHVDPDLVLDEPARGVTGVSASEDTRRRGRGDALGRALEQRPDLGDARVGDAHEQARAEPVDGLVKRGLDLLRVLDVCTRARGQRAGGAVRGGSRGHAPATTLMALRP